MTGVQTCALPICKTMIDALYFAEKLLKNNVENKELLIGMIYGRKYDKVLDFRTLSHTLSELNDVEYRDDVDDFIDKNLKNNVDLTQLNSIMRISRIKNIKIEGGMEMDDNILLIETITTNDFFLENVISKIRKYGSNVVGVIIIVNICEGEFCNLLDKKENIYPIFNQIGRAHV